MSLFKFPLITISLLAMETMERKIMWKPKMEHKCNLQIFREIVNRKYGLNLCE